MPAPQRLSIHDVDKGAYAPMLALEKYIHSVGLGDDLVALVKGRASQLQASSLFSPRDAICAIKAWNRMAVAARQALPELADHSEPVAS